MAAKAAQTNSAKAPASKAVAKPVPKSGRVTLDEVQEQLLQKFDDIDEAADWLNTWVWKRKVRVLLDGVPLPNIAGFIEVVALHTPDGCCSSLHFLSLQSLTINPKNLTIERQSLGDHLRGVVETPSGRKRGPKGKAPALDLAVSEVIRRLHEEGPHALASDLGLAKYLVEWLGEQPDVADKDIPEVDTVRKKLTIWFSQYKREK